MAFGELVPGSQWYLVQTLRLKFHLPLCKSGKNPSVVLPSVCSSMYIQIDVYIHPHLSIPWVSQALLGYGEVGGTTVGSEASIYQT